MNGCGGAESRPLRVMRPTKSFNHAAETNSIIIYKSVSYQEIDKGWSVSGAVPGVNEPAESDSLARFRSLVSTCVRGQEREQQRREGKMESRGETEGRRRDRESN